MQYACLFIFPEPDTLILLQEFFSVSLRQNLNMCWFLIPVPSGAPTDIHAEARSSTELFVSWEPPERELWNGNLLGYYVGYQEQSSHMTISPSPSTTTHNYNFKTVEVGAHYGGEVVLQGLAKYTTYSIVVQAYNSRGAGPSSEHITARTQEDGWCKFCLYVVKYKTQFCDHVRKANIHFTVFFHPMSSYKI